MGIRQWIRQQIRERAGDSGDLPAGASFLYGLAEEDVDTVHALGEFTAKTYPQQLAELVRRRAEVTNELMTMELGSRDARRAAIPRLQELLQKYPHPLAYDALILAYVDQARWDDARGAAFAARERRQECELSPWPEIRTECAALNAWTPEDVDLIREENEGRRVVPGVTRIDAPLAAQPSLA